MKASRHRLTQASSKKGNKRSNKSSLTSSSNRRRTKTSKPKPRKKFKPKTTTTPKLRISGFQTKSGIYLRPRKANKHHCPLDCKGNCRRQDGYCKTHQLLCAEHGLPHLKTEACRYCLGVSHNKWW